MGDPTIAEMFERLLREKREKEQRERDYNNSFNWQQQWQQSGDSSRLKDQFYRYQQATQGAYNAAQQDSYTPQSVQAANVRQVFRNLAKKWHPDTGGTEEAMKALNEAQEKILEVLK